ncbi:glycosyltransferase family protein [Calycomorphotria hydatis]|uniref:glycosyltransferase family 4 protein n=1 Tax=Calycomorphotria hydatis TaxID=2528027 RepID=UPI00119F3BBC|nr:glycosyltransferase family 4 protein [Calycomorphotria hydatis]
MSFVKKKILFVGETPTNSAPTLTLARVLTKRYGHDARFSEGVEKSSTRQWIGLCRWADVIVAVLYHGPDLFLLRQFALASSLSVPVVRYWVGSDVFNTLENKEYASLTHSAGSLFKKHVAVAPHLITELNSIQVQANYIPSVIDSPPPAEISDHLPRSVLVYLPTHRHEFYGFDCVHEVIINQPETKFIIVADESHSLAKFENVTSLGWTDGLSALWPEVGCLLRVTKHDGMPRMVIEALSHGRHVIYSWPFSGCRLATNSDEVIQHLEEVFSKVEPNKAGQEAIRNITTPPPVEQWEELFNSLIMYKPWLPVKSMIRVLELSIRFRFSGSLEGQPKTALKSP